MGPLSGLIGLDIDGEEGLKLFDSIAPDNMPPTLCFSTGKGKRLLFRWPAGHTVPIKSIAVNGHEALRILGAGSQTVAPPRRSSRHCATCVPSGLCRLCGLYKVARCWRNRSLWRCCQKRSVRHPIN
jgi:hypothetical protein